MLRKIHLSANVLRCNNCVITTHFCNTIFTTVDKLTTKLKQTIHSKAFSVRVLYKATVAELTKEANAENRRDGVSRLRFYSVMRVLTQK